MDPEANLRIQLEIAKRLADAKEWDDYYISDAWDLAELVLSLDEWIRKGGFIPDRWRNQESGGK